MTKIEKLLPACGFAIAVALVCVTSAFKDAPKTKSGDTMYTFEYTAPGGSYSQTNVQTKGNWSYTPDATRCNDVNSKACRIYATDNDVTPDGNGGYTLNSTFSITASSGSVSHVTATSDGTGSDYISNQSNQ